MLRRGRREGWLTLPVTALPAWAASTYEIEFHGVKIGPVTGQEERGSAVIATQELNEEHSTLITIRKPLVVSVEHVHDHARSDKDLREVLDALEDFGRKPRGAILTYLLMQSLISCPVSILPSHGLRSPIADYIKFLPNELLPTFWNDAERVLLKGTTLLAAVEAKLRSLEREFDTLKAACSNIPWTQDDWFSPGDEKVTLDDWLVVDAMYRSRALEFPDDLHALVPCLDMANHASGPSTVASHALDGEGNVALCLREGKTLVEGEEVTLSYGDNKGASEMIYSYGFLEEGVESAQALFLDLILPAGDPLVRQKMAVNTAAPGVKICEADDGSSNVRWESEFVWLACANADDGLGFEYTQTDEGLAPHVLTWEGEVIKVEELGSKLLKDEARGPIFELRAVSIVLGRVERQLQGLAEAQSEKETMVTCDGTRELVDPAFVGEVIREKPFELAMRLQEMEMELLLLARETLISRRNELAQSDTVQQYLMAMQATPENEDQDEGVEDLDFT